VTPRPPARPRAAAVLLAGALAACATPASPLERAGRAPAPLVGGAFGAAAPAVFPDPSGATVAATLAEARSRGALLLEDCVRTALAVHEDLVAGDEDRLQALLQRDLVLSGVLPDVRMLLRHDRQDPVTIGSGAGVNSTEPVRSQWSINVVQPLFQGFREFHAMKSLEAGAEALAERRLDLRRALATSVARAFFEVLEAEAELKALQDALRLDEARVTEMAARAESGLARRTEVLLLESRRETTRAAMSGVRERRDGARILLERLAGVRVDLPLEKGVAGGGPVPGREEALATAARLRPDLRAAERRAAAAALDLRAASAQRWPSVSATGNWYLDRWNYSEFATKTRWDAGLVVDLPLFAGGELDARERIADSRIRQAAIDRSRVLRAVVTDVDAALMHLKAGLERLDSLRTNERFARENLSLLQEEYRQGLATNLEVFTAQIQLQDASVGLERQEIRSRLDRLEVFLAIGRDDVVGVPPASTAAERKEKP
jgi:outer membrane protein